MVCFPSIWPVTPKQYSNRTLPYTVIDIIILIKQDRPATQPRYVLVWPHLICC